MHIRLIRHQILQTSQLLQRQPRLPQRHQHPRLLEPRVRALGRQLATSRVLDEGCFWVLEFFEHDADAADEDGVGRVDGGGGAVVSLCEGVFALFFEDFAQAVPGVVVALVGGDGGAVGSERFVVFFVCDVFVALEGEGVGESGGELGSALEAFEGLVVVALEGEGVTEGAPGLRRGAVGVDNFVGEEGEVDFGFEVPEDCRVEFHVFEASGRHSFDAGKVFFGFGVGGLFVEGAANLGKDPGGVSLAGGDGVEKLESFVTLVVAEGEVAAA